MYRKILALILFASLTALCTSSAQIVLAQQDYRVLRFDETVTVLDCKTVEVSLDYNFMWLSEGYYANTWYMNIPTADAYGITVEDENGPLPFNASVQGDWTQLTIDLNRDVHANQSCHLKIGYLAADKIKSTGPDRSLGMWIVSESAYKDNITLTVNLPKSFGVVKYEPSFLSAKEMTDGVVLSGQRLGVDAGTDYYLSVEFVDAVVRYDMIYKYVFGNNGSAVEPAPEFEIPTYVETTTQDVTQVNITPTTFTTWYDGSDNLRAKFKMPAVTNSSKIYRFL